MKSIDGHETILEKNDVVFLPAKEYYQLTNVGKTTRVLFGKRSERFGLRPVRADSQARE